ncbi:MAG TPA: sulfite exporter TauE/SafE family protein [Ghiorsea sp.]|nr:sulfite exporter TauE/SafE family protein [Ghiorsea sp.]HIP07862.1 sulfite exporter TauE/SafE family protein [Mariprofundaceae bacterium]
MELIVAAFLLGFLGSMHCVGMCGGLVTTLALSRKNIWWSGLMSYQMGRTLTYTFFGLIAGMIGMAINQIDWISDIQRALTLFAGLLMIMFGLGLAGWMPDPFVKGMATFTKFIGLTKWVHAATTSRMPMSWLMVGLFNGLLPCGLVYAGLALSLTSGSIGLSATMMFAFGLGTVPAMMFVPIVLKSASPKARGWVLKIAAILLILMGAFTMIRGSSLMHTMHDMDNMQGMEHSGHVMPMQHDMDDMDMDDMDMDDMEMNNMGMEHMNH